MLNLNEKAISSFTNLKNQEDAMKLPFEQSRKLSGIRNAIGMQVEDYIVCPKAFEYLCKAYIEQAKIFDEPYQKELINALQQCEKEMRQSLK